MQLYKSSSFWEATFWNLKTFGLTTRVDSEDLKIQIENLWTITESIATHPMLWRRLCNQDKNRRESKIQSSRNWFFKALNMTLTIHKSKFKMKDYSKKNKICTTKLLLVRIRQLRTYLTIIISRHSKSTMNQSSNFRWWIKTPSRKPTRTTKTTEGRILVSTLREIKLSLNGMLTTIWTSTVRRKDT
jgi:hypothetical protein